MNIVLKMSEEYYKKGNEVSIINKDGRFIYEVFVYAMTSNYFSLCNSAKYASNTEISNIVESYFITPHIQICAELCEAPEKWLLESGFKKVFNVKLKKKKNVGSKISSDKQQNK